MGWGVGEHAAPRRAATLTLFSRTLFMADDASSSSDTPAPEPNTPPGHPMRRLSDKILLAHAQACRERKKDVARVLHSALVEELESLPRSIAQKRQDTRLVEEAFARQEAIEEPPG